MLDEYSDMDWLYINIMDDGSRIEGPPTHSLNEALKRGLVPGWALLMARELVSRLDDLPKVLTNAKPWASIPQRSVDVEPEWDNAVRALEDYR